MGVYMSLTIDSNSSTSYRTLLALITGFVHIMSHVPFIKVSCHDLHAGNCNVGQLKLCDFGFARQLPTNNGSITDYVSTR